jgi:hypothetical protein
VRLETETSLVAARAAMAAAAVDALRADVAAK